MRVEKSKIPARLHLQRNSAKVAVYIFDVDRDDFGAIRGDMMKWISNELTSDIELGMIQTVKRNKVTSPKTLDTQRIRQNMRELERKVEPDDPTVKRILDATERHILEPDAPMS
ncbi:hypothetical protein GQ600_887 [Phytophthora cactorum]|nr:hypothetical protein GQ600_887 [Phytophthora cactorum]